MNRLTDSHTGVSPEFNLDRVPLLVRLASGADYITPDDTSIYDPATETSSLERSAGASTVWATRSRCTAGGTDPTTDEPTDR